MLDFNFKTAILSMIFFATILFSCIVGTRSVSESQFLFYKEAYSIILNKEEIMGRNTNSRKLRVAEEIVSFGNYAQFFEEQLLSNSIFSLQEMLFDSLTVGVNPKLEKIGGGKSAKKILFFSEVKKGFFFAEFFSDFKDSRFNKRPNFGESHVFLFEVNEKNLKLVDSKTLAYN